MYESDLRDHAGLNGGFRLSDGDKLLNCLTNGEASLALKQAQGTTLTSMPGFTLSYNSLDNNRMPTDGIHAEWRQDIAGAGGNEQYIRSTARSALLSTIFDLVGYRRRGAFPGRHPESSTVRRAPRSSTTSTWDRSLVRGFQPDGIGPRDISVDPQGNPLGGTKYWGASAEADFPIWGLPKEVGLRGAVFSDWGALWGYQGATYFPQFASNPKVIGGCGPGCSYQGDTLTVGGDTAQVRGSVGVSLIWASPMGPIRFDFAKAIVKNKWDQTQIFNFTGGTTF